MKERGMVGQVVALLLIVMIIVSFAYSCYSIGYRTGFNEASHAYERLTR